MGKWLSALAKFLPIYLYFRNQTENLEKNETGSAYLTAYYMYYQLQNN